ncbi:LacI family transcriptional regulator [Actibacterium mucosum KCTC 23349]|uniref:LacI family transcriptional regulator n=1 Tax=Actibacterium mucosum KCTC 23349 TaxID=1454373 RepID=A0A037ZJP4_9RHOB|nr:LacI family DNA-binding transcriptional regulator [Actibacterium mucosum]KAJ56318.1 LacI family transcriptional regulator [Actibacterium mucosum KCTC 23349]
MNNEARAKKRVTLADVAKQAGVSQMTASKVMRNTGSISEATRDRVTAAARDLGYVPNRLAGSLSSQNSDIVAVILPSINDTIYGDVVRGINEVLRPHGYMTFIGENQFDTELEEDIIRSVLSLQPAAIILTGGINRSEAAFRMLKNWQCPIVQIWDDSKSGFDGSVSPSHEAGGALVAQHFVDRGFKAPAYIGAELSKDLCAARRFDSFKSKLQAFGVVPFEVTDEALPRRGETGQTLVARLMETRPETDAIYCLNDAIALGALSWLHDNGYDVPNQVAVAGFNGTSLLQVVRTRLTTVDVNRERLGQVAAKAVVSLLNGEDIAEQTVLDTQLVQGNTT